MPLIFCGFPPSNARLTLLATPAEPPAACSGARIGSPLQRIELIFRDCRGLRAITEEARSVPASLSAQRTERTVVVKPLRPAICSKDIAMHGPRVPAIRLHRDRYRERRYRARSSTSPVVRSPARTLQITVSGQVQHGSARLGSRSSIWIPV